MHDTHVSNNNNSSLSSSVSANNDNTPTVQVVCVFNVHKIDLYLLNYMVFCRGAAILMIYMFQITVRV